MWINFEHTLPRASCAVPLYCMIIHFVIFSYLGFGEPTLLCHLITFLLATSLFVYIRITLDGSNYTVITHD